MFWRYVMLAPQSADIVPAPMLDRAGRIARGLQANVEMFLSLYQPDNVQPLDLDALECDVSVVKPGRFRSTVSAELARAVSRPT